jgi:hypothetical protein
MLLHQLVKLALASASYGQKGDSSYSIVRGPHDHFVDENASMHTASTASWGIMNQARQINMNTASMEKVPVTTIQQQGSAYPCCRALVATPHGHWRYGHHNSLTTKVWL